MKIEIGCDKFLYDMTNEEMKTIKEELTLDNPKYIQAMKYSNYKSTRIPKKIFYYTRIKNGLIVPRGYEVPFNHKICKDTRREVTVQYPPFKLSLRDTQEEARTHYLDNTDDNGLIVLPTGKGKSILGLNLAYTLRQRTLVLVHKDDLVDGWTKDSHLCFGDNLNVGIYKGKKRVIGEQITIATIQTLNRLSHEDIREFQKNFGMVIIDEVHHIASTSFDLLHMFEGAYKLGLSATPERSDGLTKAMYLHLGGLAYKYEASKDDTDILPVEVIVKRIDTPIDVPLKREGNKYVIASELDIKNNVNLVGAKCVPFEDRPRIPYFNVDDLLVMNENYININLKNILKEYKKDRSIICFFTQKKHIDSYYEMLCSKGIPSDKILKYYGDSKESKDELKSRAESKEALITLATYSIATEGTNVKAWEVAFMISSINNGKNTEQAVGRIRRSKEGKINPVRVYDYSLPNVYSIGSKHFYTRNTRYKKLGFDVKYLDPKPTKSIFSRGFNK